MRINWRELFLEEPGPWGSRLGVVVLPLLQFLVHAITLIVTEGSDGAAAKIEQLADSRLLLLGILGLPLVPAMFWGWLLGGSVGRAWYHWLHLRNEAARQTLQVTGGWCAVINCLWLLFPILLISGSREITTSQPWIELGFRLLTNVSLQVSVLLLAVGLVLPRTEEDSVQITETLRL